MLHRKVKNLFAFFPKLVFISVILSVQYFDLLFCLQYYYKTLKPFQSAELFGVM